MDNKRDYNGRVNSAGRKLTRRKAYVGLSTENFKNKTRMTKTFKKAKRSKHVIPAMSSCAVEYLKAQYDPWNLKTAPCIPDPIQLPSYKFSTHLRGTFLADGLGTGWICMNPYVPSNQATGQGSPNNINYLAPVWFSTGTVNYTQIPINLFADRSATAAAITAAGASPGYWNSSITAAQVENNLNLNDFTYNWRPVGGGIKVRYTGRADAQAGNYILYNDPGNNTTLYNWGVGNPAGTSAAPATLLSLQESNYCSVTANEIAVLHHPRSMYDLQYSDNWYGVAGASTYANSQDTALYHTIALYIQGAAPNSSFAYDCIMHWEMVGKGLPSRTASYADALGMEKVTNTLPEKPPTQPPKIVLNKMAAQVAKSLVKVGATYMRANYGAGAATAAIENTLEDMINAYTDV